LAGLVAESNVPFTVMTWLKLAPNNLALNVPVPLGLQLAPVQVQVKGAPISAAPEVNVPAPAAVKVALLPNWRTVFIDIAPVVKLTNPESELILPAVPAESIGLGPPTNENATFALASVPGGGAKTGLALV
jgi:hypothetical protein